MCVESEQRLIKTKSTLARERERLQYVRGRYIYIYILLPCCIALSSSLTSLLLRADKIAAAHMRGWI